MDNNNYNRFNMEAFEKQINIELLHEIISFIAVTTEVENARRHIKNYVLVDSSLLYSDNIQEKYGFRYLGELLERFDERFSFDIRNTRAIALALAFSYELLSDDMFVGNQKEDYLKKIIELSKRDIYLKGALYLIQIYNGTEKQIYEEFINATYSKTENLIFALSLFGDFESYFTIFKKQLYKFLGQSRTIQVIGNEKIYGWIVNKLYPLTKKLRDKESSLFKALTALPVSFVKEGKSQYTTLINQGYSREEIVYINLEFLFQAPILDTISKLSMTGEKIAVEFFKEYINSEKTHSPDVYKLLETTLNLHSKFKIKCYGCEGIIEAVENEILLANSDTFSFLFNGINDKNKSFFRFDILNSKWDSLVDEITPEDYLTLFDKQLTNNDSLTKEDIEECIAKFDSLTNSLYIDSFKEHHYYRNDIFALLVEKEVINLIELYNNNINYDEADKQNAENIFTYIWHYTKGFQRKKAFEFFKHLLDTIEINEIVISFEKLLNTKSWSKSFEFEDGLYYGLNNHYYSSQKEIDIERTFLSEEENRQIFNWLDNYMFECRIEKYVEFIQCVLKDDYIETLFSKDKLRELFDTVMSIDAKTLERNMPLYKTKFLTAEELTIEKEKEEKAKLEAEQQKELDLRQKLNEELFNAANEGFNSIYKLLDNYRWYDNKIDILYELISNMLKDIFELKNYTFLKSDIASLLKIFGSLFHAEKVSLLQIQEYTAQIQEYTEKIQEAV